MSISPTSPLSPSLAYYKEKQRFHIKILGARDLKAWKTTPWDPNARLTYASPYTSQPYADSNLGYPAEFSFFSRPRPSATLHKRSPTDDTRILLHETQATEGRTVNPTWGDMDWSDGWVEMGDRVKFAVEFLNDNGEREVIGVHAVRSLDWDSFQAGPGKHDLIHSGEGIIELPLRKPKCEQLWITGKLRVGFITSRQLSLIHGRRFGSNSPDHIEPFVFPPAPMSMPRDRKLPPGRRDEDRNQLGRAEDLDLPDYEETVGGWEDRGFRNEQW